MKNTYTHSPVSALIETTHLYLQLDFIDLILHCVSNELQMRVNPSVHIWISATTFPSP